ncbi:hypothetical protein OSTOST_19678 [Ostertagia ostertagi]
MRARRLQPLRSSTPSILENGSSELLVKFFLVSLREQECKLRMGKLAVDDPQLRKQVEVYSKALLDGKKSEEAGPFDRALTKMVGSCLVSCA